jgi:hypothetical protein
MNKKEMHLLSSAHFLLHKGINEIDDPEEFEATLRRSLRDLSEVLMIQQDRTQRSIDRHLHRIGDMTLELKGHPRSAPKFKSFMGKLKDGTA